MDSKGGRVGVGGGVILVMRDRVLGCRDLWGGCVGFWRWWEEMFFGSFLLVGFGWGDLREGREREGGSMIWEIKGRRKEKWVLWWLGLKEVIVFFCVFGFGVLRLCVCFFFGYFW